MFAAFVWYISTLWFTRDAIFSAAPSDTMYAIRIFANPSNVRDLSASLKNSPLISNRSLSFLDLQPYIQGELVIFTTKSGSRSVAIRTSSKELPNTLLDAHHIHQKSVGKNIILLSEKIESVRGLSLKKRFFIPLSYPGNKWIADIVFEDQPKRGTIHLRKDRLVVSVPYKSNQFSRPLDNVPQETVAFLSTPLWTNTDLSTLERTFSPMVSPFFKNDFSSFISQIAYTQGKIILTSDDNGMGFFVINHLTNGQKPPDLQKIIKTITALSNPKIEKRLLSDGSTIQEIIADPDAISPEQITLLGTPVFRVKTERGQLVAGITSGNDLFFTNRETLLQWSRQNEKKKTESLLCGATHAGLSLIKFKEMIEKDARFVKTSPFLTVSEAFSSIGITNHTRSTEVSLCFR